MQAIKIKADELATLGKLLDAEGLIEKVLEGLDDTFQPVIDAVNSCNTAITFDELHEKLINRKLTLHNSSSSVSVTGHLVTQCSLFRQQFPNAAALPRQVNSSTSRMPPPWQPQAHVATSNSSSSDP
ncbi:hypothetical protein PVK06_002477 [Gossypium arboreum]|uniref:Uncharacterized protein n=1 Tax=Gossypium arboreum TaxID=29729 RepID=A0ABR0R501_GOSAR|nr:hypothetical protein PVK06_002477 [Gossypium arboreum]